MKTYTFMETFECNSYLYDTTGFGGGSVDAARFQDELNLLGSDGWELVSSFSTTQSQGSSKALSASSNANEFEDTIYTKSIFLYLKSKLHKK